MKNIIPSGTALPAPAGKQSVLVLMPNIRFRTRIGCIGQAAGRDLRELEALELGIIIVSDPRGDNFISVLDPDRILG